MSAVPPSRRWATSRHGPSPIAARRGAMVLTISICRPTCRCRLARGYGGAHLWNLLDVRPIPQCQPAQVALGEEVRPGPPGEIAAEGIGQVIDQVRRGLHADQNTLCAFCTKCADPLRRPDARSLPVLTQRAQSLPCAGSCWHFLCFYPVRMGTRWRGRAAAIMSPTLLTHRSLPSATHVRTAASAPVN